MLKISHLCDLREFAVPVFGLNQRESEGYFSSQETKSDDDTVGLSFEFKRIICVSFAELRTSGGF